MANSNIGSATTSVKVGSVFFLAGLTLVFFHSEIISIMGLSPDPTATDMMVTSGATAAVLGAVTLVAVIANALLLMGNPE